MIILSRDLSVNMYITLKQFGPVRNTYGFIDKYFKGRQPPNINT